MKRIALGIVALTVFTLLSKTSFADGSYSNSSRSYHPGYAARVNHGQHHDDLEHRSYHRALDHRSAHRYPMTYRQHTGLHDNLDHEAFHDQVEHRGAHATGAYYPTRYRYYSPYPTGYGYSRGGFSLYIGR